MIKNYNRRTDMADEWDVEPDITKKGHIKKSKVVLDDKLAKKHNKPKGTYITLEADAVVRSDKTKFDNIALALKDALLSLGNLDNCLVVGLGNAHLTADALGNRVVSDLIVTRHLKKDLDASMGVMSAITPSVLGVTGIESFDIIKGVVQNTNPSCIVAVDSLASATVARLATAFQVSDAGITPGSGVGNGRIALNQSNLGCPVYSIGVPLVVFASTIIQEVFDYSQIDDAKKKMNGIEDLIVTPKDIDMLLVSCANIISLAINLSVHTGLNIADVGKFL
ncbi:MAG: GPR endopeptidase [Clostridiales bacterium]|nr:GPR endopeptidase [Clostridiales bacterium]